MAINNPDEINDLVGLYESDAGITTQNNVGVGGTPQDANLWVNQKLLSPPQNLIQATETSMPAFRATATPNISPAVSFDGVDDLLKTLTSNFFFLASHTIAMVVKFPPNLPLVNPVTLAQVTSLNALGGEVLRITIAGNLELQTESGPTTIPAVSIPEGSGWSFDTWAVVVWTIDNSFSPNQQVTLRIDQIPVGTGFFLTPNNIAAPNGLSLASFEDGTESADIEVASVAVYKRKLSGIEIIDLEDFLIDKYFTIAPPPPPPPPAVLPTLPPRSGIGFKAKTPRFADLDLDFVANPITGDLSRKLDEEAVKRALRNLIQLNRYEKPFHPEIDPGVTSLLFELINPATAVLLQRRIVEIVNHYEPRVELLAVNVEDQHEENLYNVSIEFRVVNEDNSIVVNFSLTRLR